MTHAEPDGPYQLTVASSAGRAISERLPGPAAWAIIDFITGRLLDNPRRMGAPLQGPLAGLYGAHVRDYRVEYEIDDDARTVEVVRVARRADIYGMY